MGVSTDGILFYGICIDPEEVEVPWHSEEDDGDGPEIHYAAKMGVKEPEDEYSDKPGVKEKYSKYWDEKQRINKESGCKVVWHCSWECPMFGLAISASTRTASRGYPTEIKAVEVDENWDVCLKDYCEKMDVEYEQPKWWLVSMWG